MRSHAARINAFQLRCKTSDGARLRGDSALKHADGASLCRHSGLQLRNLHRQRIDMSEQRRNAATRAIE